MKGIRPVARRPEADWVRRIRALGGLFSASHVAEDPSPVV